MVSAGKGARLEPIEVEVIGLEVGDHVEHGLALPVNDEHLRRNIVLRFRMGVPAQHGSRSDSHAGGVPHQLGAVRRVPVLQAVSDILDVADPDEFTAREVPSDVLHDRIGGSVDRVSLDLLHVGIREVHDAPLVDAAWIPRVNVTSIAPQAPP